jgi:hypothetical protein
VGPIDSQEEKLKKRRCGENSTQLYGVSENSLEMIKDDLELSLLLALVATQTDSPTTRMTSQ